MSVPGSPPTRGVPPYPTRPPPADPMCPTGQHFSHCGCMCRPNGGIEPLCYQQCDGFKPVMIEPYMPPMMKPCTADVNDVNTFHVNPALSSTIDIQYTASTIVLFRIKELNPGILDTYTPLDCTPSWDCSRNLNLVEKDHNRMALTLQERARTWLMMNRLMELKALLPSYGGGSGGGGGYPGKPIFVNGGTATATAVSSGPSPVMTGMGMGGGSTGSIGPSGEVRLSPPPDPQSWYKVLGCGSPMSFVWWKKGYPGGDMNIMQNYFLKGDTYVSKTPCPIYPMNGMCPPGSVSQTQCPACSVGPGPRCLAPCRISCVPIGTPCPSGSVCDGKIGGGGGGGPLPPPPIYKPRIDPMVDSLARDAIAYLGVPVNMNNKLPPSDRTCMGQFYYASAAAGGGVGFDNSGNSPIPPRAAGDKSVTLQTGGTADLSHSLSLENLNFGGYFDYFKANPLIAAGAIAGVAVLAWMLLRR